MSATDLRMGLIGDNISQSRMPDLMRAAGRLCGINVRYDRLVPKDLGKPAEELFDWARAEGFCGVNVTYPYKERLAAKAHFATDRLRTVGATNTVVFDGADATAWNTDYSGFMQAYRAVRRNKPPGHVLVAGAGGVGRACVHGLIDLGATSICIHDRESDRADALLAELPKEMRVAAPVGQNFDGILNCTPVGMIGLEGCSVDKALLKRASWVFDAVYTPPDTEFLRSAAKGDATCISGVELFFWQGVDAWKIFSGYEVDTVALRQEMGV